jgi:hypothetical protein
MWVLCFRCGDELEGSPGDDQSHGVCIPCAREWMADVGVCPDGPLTPAAALRCRARCPVAGQCERLAQVEVPALTSHAA